MKEASAYPSTQVWPFQLGVKHEPVLMLTLVLFSFQNWRQESILCTVHRNTRRNPPHEIGTGRIEFLNGIRFFLSLCDLLWMCVCARARESYQSGWRVGRSISSYSCGSKRARLLARHHRSLSMSLRARFSCFTYLEWKYLSICPFYPSLSVSSGVIANPLMLIACLYLDVLPSAALLSWREIKLPFECLNK